MMLAAPHGTDTVRRALRRRPHSLLRRSDARPRRLVTLRYRDDLAHYTRTLEISFVDWDALVRALNARRSSRVGFVFEEMTP